MEPTARGLYRAKEFAAKAGVTVRTLHFYDRIGLLVPTAREANGYRLYSDADLERLEQILALAFVGFELDRIKRLLACPPLPLEVALRLQRTIIAQEKHRLELALAAIDEAESSLARADESERWQAVAHVIKVFKMQNDYNWTENYYSPEGREKLAEMRRTTPHETVEAGERAWAELIAEVEAAAANGTEPASEAGRALAQRWCDLVRAFTQDDPDVSAGLNQLWSDQTHWPTGFKRPWSDAADAFITAAKAARG